MWCLTVASSSVHLAASGLCEVGGRQRERGGGGMVMWEAGGEGRGVQGSGEHGERYEEEGSAGGVYVYVLHLYTHE